MSSSKNRSRSFETIEPLLACPVCAAHLTRKHDVLVCSCGRQYAIRDERAYFTDAPEGYEGDGDGPNVAKEAWGPWRQHNFEYFKKAFKDAPDAAAVLDVGGGPGQFSELTDRFASFVSMDFRAFKPTNVIADLTKPLPLAEGVFDVVMASNVLEHIPDTRALLFEVRRVLKPGGIFVATIPFLMRVHQKPYDFNRYTNFQLEALLAAAGFDRVRIAALSHPFEVYETSQRHFLSVEIGRAKGAKKLLWRFHRFAERFRLFFLRALASTEPSPDYTEGYGMVAYRP